VILILSGSNNIRETISCPGKNIVFKKNLCKLVSDNHIHKMLTKIMVNNKHNYLFRTPT